MTYWPHSDPEPPRSAVRTDARRPPCIRGCQRRTRLDDGTMRRDPRWAAPGALLCQPCIDRLWDRLSDIVELYALLPSVTDPGSVESDGSKHTKADAPPVPLRPSVTDLLDGRLTRTTAYADHPLTWNRRGVLGVLNGWARVIREEMSLTWQDEPTVAGESAFLRKHLDWLARQPWADECHDEVVALHSELSTLCGEAKPHPIGRCPATDEHGTCGAPLFAPLFADEIDCRTCGASWTREAWERLGKMLEQDNAAEEAEDDEKQEGESA